jgi:hypothetical protein
MRNWEGGMKQNRLGNREAEGSELNAKRLEAILIVKNGKLEPRR